MIGVEPKHLPAVQLSFIQTLQNSGLRAIKNAQSAHGAMNYSV
jgi:hypothetical protein